MDKRGRHFRKESVITYLFIIVLLGVGISLLYFFNTKFTGYAVLGEGDQSGAYWNLYDYGDGSGSLQIFNALVNYYDGNNYVPISYGSCGSNCFRDWNGLIYRTSTDPQKSYINLYDPDDNYISSFGFGITGSVGGTNYKYSTLNFTWTWTQESSGNEYIFRAWNNRADFNWTQEFHFYPDQPMKIKNYVKNDLGVSITNTKFWYIQKVGSEGGIWFNGTKYTEDIYKSGEFDDLMPLVWFEDYYVFKYDDLLANGFNITDFYLGDGNIIGVNGIRILAIGITKGASILPDGGGVILDPSVTIKGDTGGADACVKGDSANKNFGSDDELLIKWGTPKRNSYLKFNISSIPNNQVVDNASLCLYLWNDQGSPNASVYHVSETWQESSITWNNQPCGTSFDNSSACNLTEEVTIFTDGDQDNVWQCWDVLGMVTKEYNNNSGLISMVLHTWESGYADKYYSKEYSDSSLWPYLNITHHTANTAPFITLVEPQNTLYTYNESIDLEFSASDNDGNLDSCWYNIDGGADVIISGCVNTTFDVSSEGNYVLTIYANDTLGLESSDSVSFNVDLTGISLSISEPTGTKTSRTEIPLTYTATGNNLTCWYNVKTSIGGEVIANTTLVNCSDSSFDVSADGDYILNLYVNNTLGNSNSSNSSFSVDTSSSPPPGGGSSGGGGGSIIVSSITELEVAELSNLIISSGDVKKLTWNIKNTGTKFLNDCEFKSGGEFSSWISFSEGLKNLATGEEYVFIFDLSIPENTEPGQYALTVSLSCKEKNESSSFIVEIIEKQIGFDLIKIERSEKDQVKILYSLEELSGLEQDVELQFLLFDSNNEKTAEVKETKTISANSKQDFEIFIPIDTSLEGELNLLVNLNSETYSGFAQESIVLGAPATGLPILGDAGATDNIISVILVVLFLIFVFFIIRRIFSHKKKLKPKKTTRKTKKK